MHMSSLMTVFVLRRSVLLLSLSLVLLGAGAAAQTQDSRMARIASALRDEQYQQALQMLHVALAESPGNAELWTMQGVAFEGAGATKQALASFKHVLKLM